MWACSSPPSYIDATSLYDIPRLMASALHTYPGFDANVEGPRFKADLQRTLTRHIAFKSMHPWHEDW